ncbi:cytochrome c family protein, partial [bacterium]|nr:cytochrome c family protein [bacterium]
MRKILFAILTTAIMSFLMFSLTGCSGEDGAQGPAGPAGTNPPSPPIITAVIAAPDSVGTGEYTTIFVQAYDPNGDEMTYAWTTTGGTVSATTGAFVTWTAPTELGLYQVSVTVTDDDGSDDGSVTVGVNVYVPSVYPSYMGNNATRCAHCHDAHVEGWIETHHAVAYTAPGVSENIYCIQCHTTGFDDTFDFAGNKLTTGLDNGGYDQNPVVALQGVQCEACHGPMGPEFSDHNPDMEMPLTGMACDRCH